MMRLSPRLIFSIGIIFLSLSCNREKKTLQFDGRLELLKKTQRRNEALYGEKIKIDDFWPSDTLQVPESKKIIIAVLMLSDCSGCRKTTYEVAQRIDKLHGEGISYVIGTDIKTSSESVKNGLLDLPYLEDPELAVKRKIGLSHTPSLVYISDQKIENILSLFPFDEVTGYDEEKQITDFIASVIFDEE